MSSEELVQQAPRLLRHVGCMDVIRESTLAETWPACRMASRVVRPYGSAHLHIADRVLGCREREVRGSWDGERQRGGGEGERAVADRKRDGASTLDHSDHWQEEIGVRQRDLGEPSTALRPQGEVKVGPRPASQMASLEKASAWAGRAKDVFLGPCDSSGSASPSVAAPKRQHPGPTEWHRGQDAAPCREPRAEVE
ncbi:hypothetical protein NDU88_001685 [Pleurodeles waltl]|uniref:Uncharacterized protein n=1 Tax=Pleurodeles waltl TaxID=8319 RepID=A0AAV7SZW4_PLEWA|nr:hypothetical protein NDU88_001685 [Pleurodeles waltl]